MTTETLAFHSLLAPENLMPLLAATHLLPQLLREQMIEQAIASITCTEDETAAACQQFWNDHGIGSTAEQQPWLRQYGLVPEQVAAIATRKLRLQKFQQAAWGSRLESYFLKRKRQLDQVVYSLIRTKDPGLAHELYFRLEAGEQSFTELATAYSEGSEARTGGFMGPVEVGTLHPHLAQRLLASQPGQLWSPQRIGEWLVILRLEQWIPVTLNSVVEQRLLDELLESWLQEQVQQLPPADRAWMGAA